MALIRGEWVLLLLKICYNKNETLFHLAKQRRL